MLAGTSGPPLQIGDWVLDPNIDSISRGTETQKLEPRTTRLLLLLAESPGAVISVDRILAEVWSGVVVGPASAYQAVSRLRRLLGDTDPDPTYIATVPRKGYRLVATVRRMEASQIAFGRGVQPAPADGAIAVADPTPGEDGAGLTPGAASSWAAGSAPAGLGSVSPAGSAAPDSGWATPKEPTPEVAAGSASQAGRASAPDVIAPGFRAAPLLGLAAVLLAAIGILAWIQFGMRPPPVAPIETSSVVVLPFVDMTSEKRDQAFCDGLTEELSNWLAQIPTLRVVARTSAFAYLGRAIDVRTIGKELGASHVLEGSLRRSGNQLRVTAQLVNTHDGYHVWSATFDRSMEDVVKVQEEIARSVADNLEIRLTDQTAQRFAARRGAKPEAYQLYLLAGHHRHALTRDSNNRAIEQYQQALALDERFALAYAGLASAYLNQSYLDGLSIPDVTDKVEPLLATGLHLNPGLPELYTARGALRADQGRYEEALRDLRHAIDLTPNNSQALAEMGYLFIINAQPRDSLASYSAAAVLDPLDFNLHARRCVALTDMARFDEADVACTHARSLAPQGSWAFVATSWLDWARGRIDAALKWNDLALKASPNEFDLYDDRASLLLSSGRPAEARAALEQARAIIGSDDRISLRLAQVSFFDGGAPALRAQLSTAHFDSSRNPTTLLRAARLELLAGDLPAARVLVNKALATDAGKRGSFDDPWYERQGESDDLSAALVELQTGDLAAAQQRLAALLARVQRLKQAGVERYGVYVLEAETLALRGSADEAMSALNRAADLGWQAATEAELDPALASVHIRGDFQVLLERMRRARSQPTPKADTPAT